MPAATKLKWANGSKENPGYSVWHAKPRPGVLYVIRQKKKTATFTPTFWRVFARSTEVEPLRTIYMGDTVKECKAFVQEWEEQVVGHQVDASADR